MFKLVSSMHTAARGCSSVLIVLGNCRIDLGLGSMTVLSLAVENATLV